MNSDLLRCSASAASHRVSRWSASPTRPSGARLAPAPFVRERGKVEVMTVNGGGERYEGDGKIAGFAVWLSSDSYAGQGA